LLGALAAQLARFDDDAWVALANRGLLRRALKDLETQQAEIVDDGGADPATLAVSMGGQHILFDVRGPAQARCSCPAAGVCQHILAAAIGLQRITAGTLSTAPAPPGVPLPAQAPAGEGQAESGDGPVAAADPDGLDLLAAELLALPAEALTAHAGLAGYRWAWEYVQALDLRRGLTVSGDRSIVLALRHPRITLRYMGGGLAAMVAGSATTHLPRMQVAAALAFRRLNGVEDAPAAARSAKPSATLSASSAADAPRRPPLQSRQDESRRRLLAAVCGAAEDCLSLGLSHLSDNTQQRFNTLAVWAQGADCYRLALLLRRIADHAAALLARGAGADEHRLLEQLALAVGLARALQAAGERPPQHLLGRARSSYEGGGTLDLLGLGAHAWRTPAGYTGLTMLFWSESSREFTACTEARPVLQRGFNPLARYRAPGPWQGLHAPAAATGRLVRLVNPQLNDTGRLSPAERTTASVETAAGFAARLPARARWADIAAERAQWGRSLLAEPDPMRDWCVLAPRRWGLPVFDAARQTLCWTVYDSLDAPLVLELAYSPFNMAAIERIELHAARGIAPGTLLVARIADTAGGLLGEPLSLVLQGDDGMPVDCLHFPQPEAGAVAAAEGALPAGPRGSAAAVAGSARLSRGPQPALQPLREFRHWLNRQAERGLQEHRLPAFGREYAVRSAQLAAQGHSLFQRGGPATPELLLWACYRCMQLDQLAEHRPAGADPDS
jgi:hypothetical protein